MRAHDTDRNDDNGDLADIDLYDDGSFPTGVHAGSFAICLPIEVQVGR